MSKDFLREKIYSMSGPQLRDLLDSLSGGFIEDGSRYVITNGSASLTEFHLVGRSHSYNFSTNGAIIFENENEARMVLALLCGLTAWDFDLDCSSWEIKKIVSVKPRVKFTKLRRKWAKAYLRCQKAVDADGYIYCKDCVNRGCFHWCPTDPNACMEFCENYSNRRA